MFDFLPLVSTPPDSSLLYTGHYDPVLVCLSVVVAMFASYASLLVAQHISNARTSGARHWWTAVGGLCLGGGIWAMHFVGMLAFSLPCVSSYNATITLLSTIPGILASTVAIKIISRRALSPTRLATGGLLIGAGIGAMHYAGMAAMRLDGLIRYDSKLFVLSILVAIALATLALWIKFRLHAWSIRWNTWVTVASAVVMGLAVSGMHYTAMAAAYFIRDGDNTIASSGISPTFLASIVLIATSLIVVMTIVATYVGNPNLLSVGRSYKLIGLLIVGWGITSWLSADYYYNRLGNNLYAQEAQLARQQAEQIVRNVDESIQLLKGLSLIVSRDDTTLRALRRFGADVMPSRLAYGERRQRWSSDSSLRELNTYLGVAASKLQADEIFLVNAAGDCVAASNAGKVNSFVGSNYGDREYFRQARSGQLGHQYAVGRTSGVPGLYYATPVFMSGRFVGAVVVKRDVEKIGYWTNPANAFIADANGVVVLAADKRFEFRTLSDAAVSRLSAEQKLMQYRRSTLDSLQIVPWGGERFPAAVRVAASDVPVVMASGQLPAGSITVHVLRPLGELLRLDTERYWLFLLLTAAGSMLIVAASAIVFYLRESRRAEADLRVAATAFESLDGMLVTDENKVILRVNQAFTDITDYTADEVVGLTPSLLSSGRHDAVFYSLMWNSIVQEGAWQGEIWNRRKNGEVYPQWLGITAVKGSHGEITHYVGTMSDISQRKAAESEIEYLAFYDFVTRLPNRRLLTDRLNQARAACARSGRRGALLFIDLDNFKTLNDTLGHDKGDLLLEQVAQRLVGCVREGDTVARFGGDEFMVLLENLSENSEEAASHTRAVGEKILATLNQAYVLDGHRHHGTSSIGATLFSSQKEAVDDLLKQADLAMYQAKEAGRNAMRFFDLEMQSVVTARAALEADLRQSLELNEFVLYYQPQVDQQGRVTGLEALVRWQHPQRGFVSPGEFIPLAEDTGLILPLGHWVLETACRQLLAWASQAELASLSVAVNISARQFRHPDFAQEVLAVIDQTGADPLKLKLELTESLLVDDLEDIIAKMTALKARGVSFSLDDFGTGYSSLSYLKRLPLDQLKIDQSFVRDILSDPNDAAIARTIVALANSLGLSVIAEGVETGAQRDCLASAGCYAYQGYLFARPLPVDEVLRFVTRA